MILRILKYLIVSGLILAGLFWLYQYNGTVSIAWLGYVVDVQMVVLLPALLCVLYLVVLLDRAVLWVLHMPERMRRKRQEGHMLKGYQSLMDGFTAIAAGDANHARKLSQKAERFLKDAPGDATPLTLLLSAQTAQLEGNQQKASQCYESMMNFPASEFLGLRGLLVASLRKLPADTSLTPDMLHESLVLAERAYALRPETRWVVMTLVELYIKSHRWKDAGKLIEKAQKKEVLEEIAADRLLAIVHYHQAEQLWKEERLHEALTQAQKAHRERLAFVPATELLADLHMKVGSPDKAIKLIEKSWRYSPHPGLYRRYIELQAAQTPEKRLKLVERMTKAIADHFESHIAVAKAAIDAKQWSKARNHLKAALAMRETKGVYRLMARFEEQMLKHAPDEAGELSPEHWQEKAQDAEADAQWVCDSCGTVHKRWHAICHQCGAFNSILWIIPTQHHAPRITGHQLPETLEVLEAA